ATARQAAEYSAQTPSGDRLDRDPGEALSDPPPRRSVLVSRDLALLGGRLQDEPSIGNGPLGTRGPAFVHGMGETVPPARCEVCRCNQSPLRQRRARSQEVLVARARNPLG